MDEPEAGGVADRLGADDDAVVHVQFGHGAGAMCEKDAAGGLEIKASI